MSMNLQELLKFLEERTDPAREKEKIRLHDGIIAFEDMGRLPLEFSIPVDERVKPFPYAEAFEDFEKMLYNELCSAPFNPMGALLTGDDTPLMVRPNFGIGLIPSLLGLKSRLVMDNMPWVTHAEGADALKRILDAGVPGPEAGLMPRSCEFLSYCRETLRPYPRLSACLYLTQPDMQGPFDNLHLVVGNEVFLYLYDEEDLVRDLMRLITQTYIAARKHLNAYISPATPGGNSVVHKAVYGGSIVIKEDTATANISEGMYEEFVRPSNEKLYEALGGSGSIHYCGAVKPWHDRQMLKTRGLKSINYGNPDQQNFPAAHEALFPAKISVVGYGETQPDGFLDGLNGSRWISGVSRMCVAPSLDAAKKILAKDREISRA